MNIYQELLKIFDPKSAITIFDVGACDCEDSIRYATMFPYSKVYAFEPIKENYEKCLINTAQYRNIKVYDIAFSSYTGTAEMYVSSGCPEGYENTARHNYGNKSSSLFEPKEHLNRHPWCKFETKQNVILKRLDLHCKLIGVNEIDFIHCDSQGSELKILQGAGALLEKIKVIYLEISTAEMYKGQPLKEEVEIFMEEYGFEKIGELMDVVQGDQLWKRI